MDAETLGAVVLAVISGAGGELGARLWAGLGTLARHPFRHRPLSGETAATPQSGDAEFAALEKDPGDERQAVALAEALIARADADAEFRAALQSWWELARQFRAGNGNITNTISGGTQHGPVLQGRDFGDIILAPASSEIARSGSLTDPILRKDS